MTVVALVLLAIGLADIGDRDTSEEARSLLPILGLVAAAVLGAGYLSGMRWYQPLAVSVALLPATWLWLQSGRGAVVWKPLAGPRGQLLLVAGLILASIALSGAFPGVRGPLASWYRNLALSVNEHWDPTQMLVAIGGAIFLTSTSNRIVRLGLQSAHSEQERLLESGEERLRGGRHIGAIERLIVAALLLTGSPEGAALIVAAKSVIRLPEIRSDAEKEQGAGDSVAEYFLIGTLTSIVLAGAVAALVLGAGA